MTQSEFRQKRKHAGVCVQCGREDAYTMTGRSLCADCAEYFSRKQSEYRKDPDKWAKMQACKKDIRETRKANGLCPMCGKSANSGYVLCDSCRAKRRNYMNRYNNHPPRGEYGICWRCNKRESIPGKRLCPECYKKAVETCRMTAKKRRESKLSVSGD